MTKVQRGVLDRLRAGEYICWNFQHGHYQFGSGGKIPNQTFRSLAKAKLIRPLIGSQHWVAAEKGHGDAHAD